MRILVIFVILCSPTGLLAPAALAEQKTKPNKAQKYAFAAIGSANAEQIILHFGGGGEWNLYKGLGLGAEVGYAAPKGYLGQGVGLISVNGNYTFGIESSSRLKPFVTAGYSLAFGSGTVNAINFGGGVHYWFSNRMGLRLELRDHVSPLYWNVHLWQGRIGLDLR